MWLGSSQLPNLHMHGSRLASVCVISCLTDVRGFTEGDKTIVVGVREGKGIQI